MPPNILLIHSDQHRYDCVGAHGLRPHLATPNLDRLCADGTTYSHAFSAIPICTPARASLMTGAWPTAHGSFCLPSSEMDRAARPELPTLTNLLAGRGYRVAWTGKYHGELEEPPGPRWGIEEYIPIWHAPDFDYGDAGCPPCGIKESIPAWKYGRFREQNGLPPLACPNGGFGDPDTVCPAEKSSLAWQADHVIRQIESRSDGPFFVRWDPPEPHLPCAPTSGFAERFAECDLPPWPSFPDPLTGKPAALRRQARIWGVEGWTWKDWLRTVRLYHAIIAEMDHHIGRVLDRLDALGLADNTLVVYSTDHGDFCGGHGLIDKHFNMYDDVLRVPLIARWPGRVAAGATCDAFVSGSIDIARTLLAAAGIEPPASFVGQDIVALARDPGHPRRDYAYAQYFGADSGAYSCRMLRDRRYKFVYHPVGDRHEFYDLETDPGELHNRIDDPGLSAEITRLKSDLWDTMAGQGDRLANHSTKRDLQA